MLLSHKIVKKYRKNIAVTQPRPTHIPYQCAKFVDDGALFNVILNKII